MRGAAPRYQRPRSRPGSTSPGLQFLVAASFAEILLLRRNGIPLFAKANHDATLCALCWLVCGRILQFLEVVLIGAIPYVHLGLYFILADVAFLPFALMFFSMVKATQGVATMVSMAATLGIREHHVLIFIVANPLIAAFCLDKFGCLAAETAFALCFRGPILWHLHSFFSSNGKFTGKPAFWAIRWNDLFGLLISRQE